VADDLPISAVLGAVVEAVRDAGACVLQAPPGAGKTTQVPLALDAARVVQGKILMLEPRRVAARAAAERLAELLGEAPGGAVGYRMRGASVAGTRIEVITEGILTRMLQSDPELSGVGCVIFDEFHERALQADLGLALVLEVRGALREDLAGVAMSATLDAGFVAGLMGDAPVVTSEGRAFPVETRYLERPLGPGTLVGRGFVSGAVDLVQRAAVETDGDMLVFLPGQGEINRVAGALKIGAEVVPLHGGLPFKAQRAALRPGEGRRVVLATAIAETSLTIPGVRVVVDCGRARRARLDPATGMSRLVTERVTRAEAEQRRGRAGRVAEGICYRMWTKGEEGALAAFPPPEIETADLVPLALELAMWGAADPAELPFPTPPAPAAYAVARELLAELGALDAGGALTDRGRAMGALPVHPRLARMLLEGGAAAADLAALAEARDPVPDAPADMTLRLDALADTAKFEASRPWRADRGRLAEVRAEAKRLRKLAPKGRDLSPGAMAALAWPDRVGLRRPGDEPRYLLSGGSGAFLDAGDEMGAQRMLVALDLDGDRREARIRRALPVREAELRELFAERIVEDRLCRWSRRHRQVEARVQERLGALVLSDKAWKDAPDEARIPALLEGVRDLGLQALSWSAAAQGMRARAEWLRRAGTDLPDMGEQGLLDGLEDWLAPFLPGTRSFGELAAMDLHPALAARLGPGGEAALRQGAPTHFTAPTGTNVRIDYSGAQPEIAVRLQEMFGLAKHPSVAGVPLLVTLLSPAQRPVQTTADLPGFWASSYADVRKDMRGRYPKHPWPDDPLAAAPTRRAKPAGKG